MSRFTEEEIDKIAELLYSSSCGCCVESEWNLLEFIGIFPEAEAEITAAYLQRDPDCDLDYWRGAKQQ